MLDDWFEKTIFELKIEQRADVHLLNRMSDKKEFLRWQRENAAHQIAKGLLRKEMYYREVVTDHGHEEITTTSVLVIGTPRFIKGRNGKLRYVRD